MDAIGVALAASAGSYLAVFLTRLGATNLQIGLLTAMPAFTGFFLSIIAGQFLQRRRNIAPWYGSMRLIQMSAHTLTGILPFILPQDAIVPVVLALRMAITVPQTLISIAFTVLMNAVAGPKHRYALLSRRWSLMGSVKTITVMLIGQLLILLTFPLNYQVMFILFSLGGWISYYYSSRIQLPEREMPPRTCDLSLRQRVKELVDLVRGQHSFRSFTIRRFIFALGATIPVSLLPIYYVREVQASDAWIGVISSAQTAVTLVGYFIWTRQRKARGSRFVLLWTTLAVAIYPALVASTQRVALMALFAGLVGIFQAGLNLVFFDELMKNVPPEQSSVFVSLAQTLQHLSALLAPLIGTLLADQIGIQGALLVSAGVTLVGFALFALGGKGKK